MSVANPIRITPTDVPVATDVLARAFFDDPLFMWVEPDAERRRRLMPWMMGVGATYGAMFGEVYGTGADLKGAAVWLPPGESIATPERLEQAGFVNPAATMGDTGLQRFGTFMEHAEELHHRLMPQDHWYLMILGVDPPHQGRGFGGLVLQPILQRADQDGMPCYLETAKERNLAFYRKHGFEVVHEGRLADGGPRFWAMRRSQAAS